MGSTAVGTRGYQFFSPISKKRFNSKVSVQFKTSELLCFVFINSKVESRLSERKVMDFAA